jgi:hypothetical protein
MHKECLPSKGWKVLEGVKALIKKHNAIMAGGTALSLHIGHRVSADLDFFTGPGLNVESVISGLRKTGLPFRIISEGEGFLIADVDGIKVSIFGYDYPFLEKPLMYKGIPIAGLLDIASMKVIAISQRGTKRDLIDLYFILREVPFHRIAGHMIKRFGRERVNPVHIGKSLVYFSDAESNPEPSYIKGNGISWGTVKEFYKRHVRQFVLDLDAAAKKTTSS